MVGRVGKGGEAMGDTRHRQRRDRRVERVLARRGERFQVRPHRLSRKVIRSGERAALDHRTGEHPRKDLDDEGEARRLERPDVEAGRGEPMQGLHAIQRAAAHLARPDELEGGLG